MKKKKIVCLFLFAVLVLVLSSCYTRSISDIKPAMTKDQVISLWGSTELITRKNVDGLGTLEIWEYHFEASDTICTVIFVHDKVNRTECRTE